MFEDEVTYMTLDEVKKIFGYKVFVKEETRRERLLEKLGVPFDEWFDHPVYLYGVE